MKVEFIVEASDVLSEGNMEIICGGKKEDVIIHCNSDGVVNLGSAASVF
jgi:hypothetical protein